MRRVLSLLVVAVFGVLSGCRALSSCQGPSDIGDGGQSIPPLHVPVGLETPKSAEALKVPELNEPERPRKQSDKCLDQPPSYFPERKPGAEAEKPAG